MSAPVPSWSVRNAKNPTTHPAEQWNRDSLVSEKTKASQFHCPNPSKSLASDIQPLEPMLLPKLRIHFADFPWSHCSIDQRLFTSESRCGYRYGPSVRDEISGRASMRMIKTPNGAKSAPLSRCVQTPSSNWNGIRGVSNVKEKRKLSSGLTTLKTSRCQLLYSLLSPQIGFGMFVRIPFPPLPTIPPDLPEESSGSSQGLSKEDFLGG